MRASARSGRSVGDADSVECRPRARASRTTPAVANAASARRALKASGRTRTATGFPGRVMVTSSPAPTRSRSCGRAALASLTVRLVDISELYHRVHICTSEERTAGAATTPLTKRMWGALVIFVHRIADARPSGRRRYWQSRWRCPRGLRLAAGWGSFSTIQLPEHPH
jgi:hypothetical protein